MANGSSVSLTPLPREGELEQRVAELEDMVDAMRKEIALIKQFEWGQIEDPPTIKKDIC